MYSNPRSEDIMKRTLILGTLALFTASALAADAGTKETVKAAAKKLAEKASYSWKTTTEMGQSAAGSRFRPGPTEGKTERDGLTCLSMTRGETSVMAVMKGTKAAIKTDEGWQTPDELSGGGGQGGPNPARFAARSVQNYKVPAAEVESLLEKVKDLTLSGDAYAGDLTEEGAKALMSFGRRPGAGGGEGPAISGAKGSVKIWLKDGMVAKYAVTVQGSMSVNGNDMNLDRTATTEIKDVGTTKVEVPAEAKAKVS